MFSQCKTFSQDKKKLAGYGRSMSMPRARNHPCNCLWSFLVDMFDGFLTHKYLKFVWIFATSVSP